MQLSNKPESGFIEEIKHDEITYEIKRWIDRLDQTAIDFEARWGIGRLPDLVSAVTRDKWEKQREKLHDAIMRRDVQEVSELVNGTIRAYNVLEAEATSSGYRPAAPEFIELQHEKSGQIYRICTNLSHARNSAAENVKVFTLFEIAEMIHFQEHPDNIIPQRPRAQEIKSQKVSWDGTSDSLPF